MIFNSLGSNYDLNYVLTSLLSLNKDTSKKLLDDFLSKKYGGKAVLLYKGREAIKLALKILNLPKGSRVGVTGFTCFVVHKAIVENGLTPVFLDIQKDSLNFSHTDLKNKKNLKVLIIQNTLGDSCDIQTIAKYCKDNGIILLEDLAHSAGIKYKNGIEAGMAGDFAALSFSQDKMIDAVSGGALIIKNSSYFSELGNIQLKQISLTDQLKDRFYPLITYLIRKTYPFGIGKAIHFAVKRFNILSRPLPESGEIALKNITGWHANLALKQFKNLKNVISHREAIASIYKSALGGDIRGVIRYPFLVNDREMLIEFLRKKGIFISDIWYDAPVAPKKFMKKINYANECKNSEYVSEKLINLPTHINVSRKDAYRIARLIKTWQNIHQK